MTTRLLRVLSVEPEEAGAVWSLTLLSFFMGLGGVLFMTAALALFLAEFDAAQLPYVYIGVAVTAPIFGITVSRLGDRRSFAAGQVLILGTLCAMLLTATILIQLSRPAWTLFALPLISELLLVGYSLGFWPLASRLFDLRQGKRLFSLLGLGFRVGQIAGGLAIPLFIDDVGSQGLLWACCASFVIALLTLVRILALRREELSAGDTTKTNAKKRLAATGFSKLLRSKYILLLVVFAAIPSVAYNLIDFLFLDAVERDKPSEEDVASFLGYFRAAMNGAMAFCMLFVGGRVMSRFGLRLGILIKPLCLLGLTGATLGLYLSQSPFAVLFWLFAAMKLLDVMLRFVFEVPSIHVLKLPFGAAELSKTNTLLEAIVRPVMNGVGGVLLLGFTRFFDSATVPILVCLIGALLLWTWNSLATAREYRVSLLTALRGYAVGDSAMKLEGETLEIVRSRLGSSNPVEVVYALGLLDRDGPDTVQQALPDLLAHPSEDVRLAALGVVARRRIEAAMGDVRRLTTDDSPPRLRAEAVKVLGGLGDPELARWVDDDDLGVRIAALSELLRRGVTDTLCAAVDQLRTSADPRHRVAAAQVVAEIGSVQFSPVVEELLGDADPDVRPAALVAAGRLPDKELWKVVVDRLGDPRDRRAAIAGLSSAGERILPQLDRVLAPTGATSVVAFQALRACAHIRGPRTIDLLLRRLDHPSGEVRRSMHSVLRLCGLHANEEQRGRIEERISEEAGQAVRMIRALGALRDDARLQSLCTSLLGQVRQCRESVLDLLGFIHDRETIQRAQASLRDDTSGRRAIGLELLETTSAKDFKPLLPLFAQQDPDAASIAKLARSFGETSKSRDDWLVELATAERDNFTRALALRAIAELQIDFDFDLIPEDAAPVVREAVTFPREEEEAMPDLSLIERVLFLKTVPVFQGMSDELLVEVASILEEARYEPGETVADGESVVDSIYLVVHGRFESLLDGEPIHQWQDGDSMGEIAAFTQKEYPGVVVRAVEPTLALRLDAQVFRDLVYQFGEVAVALMQRFSKTLDLLLEQRGGGTLTT